MRVGAPKNANPVVVIGGGLAGLAAATALAEAGVRVHLIEARPALGGRASTYRDPRTGERIDNGQHILAGCYRETLIFLARLGTVSRLHRPSTLRIPMIDEQGRRTELALPPLSAPMNLLAGVLAWDGLSLGERLSVLRVGRALRGAGQLSERETVRGWLERHGQSPHLCRLLWEPLALAALNQSIDDASAASFVAVTARMFGPEPDAATLLIPAVTLEDLYVVPARSMLERLGGRVTSQARAKLWVGHERLDAVIVGDERIPAAAVIVAVPWHALHELFGEVPAAMSAIVKDASMLQSAPIVTVNLWLEDYAGDDPFLGLPGRTFQWLFDRRRLLGEAQAHLSLVSSGAERSCAEPNDRLIATALQELTDALPAARQATVRHAAVVKERRATFSLKPDAPPRPGTRTPIDGLLLAGDWTATGLPATIESAVLSGHRAASAVLAGL